MTKIEEGPVERENRSIGRGEKERVFCHCGGREMKGLLKGGETVSSVEEKIGLFQRGKPKV